MKTVEMTDKNDSHVEPKERSDWGDIQAIYPFCIIVQRSILIEIRCGGKIDIEDQSVDANADVRLGVLNWSMKLSEIIENNQWKWSKWWVEMNPIDVSQIQK